MDFYSLTGILCVIVALVLFVISEFADAGGLMFYGASLPDMYRRSATYVDRILQTFKAR